MARSGTHRTRVVGVVVLAVVAVVVGFATSVVAAVATPERVTSLWASATVADDGSAQIEEVIDYDFGGDDRHGILRDVPGLRTSAPIEVSSPDAPDSFTVTGSFPPQLKIGDPDQTVSGQHRYVLRYTLDGVAPGGRLAWDAVGTGWQVDIETVEVHVVAATAPSGQHCVTGATGSTQACSIDQPEPGHLVAHVDRVPAGEGVTVSATAGEPLATAPALSAPPAPVAATRTGTSPLVPGLLAGVLALLAALLAARMLRQAGRERVPATLVPALGPPGDEARIDLEDLGGLAAPTATLPTGLTPSQGGVLLADGVRSRHKAAWLVEQAVAGTLDLVGGDRWESDDLTLVRLAPGGDPTAQGLLDRAFRGRDRIVLGRYDKGFAEAWTALGEELSMWRRSSGLWDHAADSRVTLVRVLGTLVGVIGAGLAVLGGWLSAGQVPLPLVLAGLGGVLAGAGFAGLVRGSELRVLTAPGSAAWLQAESLRQFLAQSPPTGIDAAVAGGRLGIYTAWALALGQAQRWKELASSRTVPGRQGYHDDPYYRYAMYSPVFVHSCSTASTAPSSSSSSGGGGGSVGAGAGGGGGGSW